ncbi:hypothetical protein GCM10010112_82690 [Actinoplanes lobatus]|uniref:Uncharacterized protein n=1 Tax=Actinoplanes lobatus TaxID=113568 RepID=A0A7W7HL39_9ACTN|nr:hypothetical protein [Actinoplanes lobatus]MBB4752543.1 hypothetical protein [Actinoplanes lobatus]GGN93901.1 hypothetical protein GCM10010112_82690 [Actinoplanes lobatus]GIE44842.1 hypothetical protein Alo02nite_77400 [Actinoplanes lobatus]
MIGDDLACRVCGYALNPGGEHPVTSTGHTPQPVPADQLADVYRRCHLCSIGQPIWAYHTDQIEAHSIAASQIYATRWHTCWNCATLIERDDPDTLTRRCATVMGWPATDPRTRILAAIHRAIVGTRAPGRTLLTTGIWPPAHLKAGTLPKIRDRLTHLLRGPHLLDRFPSRLNLADSLEQARLYWIDPEFTTLAATAGEQLPAVAVTDRIVPAGSGLLTWPHPVGRHQLAAASWTPRPGGWQLTAYRSLTPDLPAPALAELRHQIGWLIPAHTADITIGDTLDSGDPLAILATTWLIIAQQLTQAETTTADPPISRAYSRAGRKPPQIRTLRIKAPGRRTTTTSTGTGAARATPDHRYWVSAHTRQQPYGPGRTLRRPVDIDPFLKGPDGAPIKPSTTVRILGQQ